MLLFQHVSTHLYEKVEMTDFVVRTATHLLHLQFEFVVANEDRFIAFDEHHCAQHTP